MRPVSIVWSSLLWRHGKYKDNKTTRESSQPWLHHPTRLLIIIDPEFAAKRRDPTTMKTCLVGDWCEGAGRGLGLLRYRGRRFTLLSFLPHHLWRRSLTRRLQRPAQRYECTRTSGAKISGAGIILNIYYLLSDWRLPHAGMNKKTPFYHHWDIGISYVTGVVHFKGTVSRDTSKKLHLGPI